MFKLNLINYLLDIMIIFFNKDLVDIIENQHFQKVGSLYLLILLGYQILSN
jgi:hypothetical protein